MNNYFTGKKRLIIYGLFMLLGVFIAIIVLIVLKYNENKLELFNEKMLVQKKMLIKERHEKKIKSSFSDLDIYAKSFYIYNLSKSEEIFSKNKDKKLPIASITKIATADVFMSDNIEDVEIIKENLAQADNNGLRIGEVFSGSDLVSFMMTSSSNDAGNALTNKIGKNEFIKKMNLVAEKNKMDRTLFLSETGLDVNENIAGSYSTSFDIFKLVSYFYKKYPELSNNFSKPRSEICSLYKNNKLCHKIDNTNKLFFEKCLDVKKNNSKDICEKTEKYEYEILFSKTGYTNLSGGSLSMVVKIKNQNILIVLLGSGKNERFLDLRKLSNSINNFFNIKILWIYTEEKIL